MTSLLPLREFYSLLNIRVPAASRVRLPLRTSRSVSEAACARLLEGSSNGTSFQQDPVLPVRHTRVTNPLLFSRESLSKKQATCLMHLGSQSPGIITLLTLLTLTWLQSPAGNHLLCKERGYINTVKQITEAYRLYLGTGISPQR